MPNKTQKIKAIDIRLDDRGSMLPNSPDVQTALENLYGYMLTSLENLYEYVQILDPDEIQNLIQTWQNNVNSRLDTIETGIDGAGYHNSIYRGKNLGTNVTPEQWDRIADGTFRDLYIGDYWTRNGTIYRIAAFNYYYNTGDTPVLVPHVTLVPDDVLYTHRMNSSNTTEGAYLNSEMHTTGLGQAKTKIKADFPGRVLEHRRQLTFTVAGGKASSWNWANSEVELMNEIMVYGSTAFGSAEIGSSGVNTGLEKSQLPLFALRPDLIGIRESWWLRDIVSTTEFALVHRDGFPVSNWAIDAYGVRPVFSIA